MQLFPIDSNLFVWAKFFVFKSSRFFFRFSFRTNERIDNEGENYGNDDVDDDDGD